MKGLCGKAFRLAMGLLIATMGFPAAAWAQVGEGAPLAASAVPMPLSLPGAGGCDIGWYTSDPESEGFGIETAAQLRGLSALVNGTAEAGGEVLDAVSFAGKAIYQLGDIDLGATAFTPIGTADRPFAGAYDGGGHAVKGLQVSGLPTHVGLFGCVSAEGSLDNVRLENGGAAAAAGVAVSTDADYVANVGSLAGRCDGAVRNCSSDVPVTVRSDAPASEEHPYVVQNAGGLVGYARGDMASCSYAGTLDVQVGSDTLDADSSNESLRIADSFGGIVGRFGDPDVHGTLSDSRNEGDVVVQTQGAGAADRFGTTTYACAFFVGGIAGYSNGSVANCRNGAYNPDTRVVTGRVLTGVYSSEGSAELEGNRGADQTGGIVGGLRSMSDAPDKYNDGDPDDPVEVRDCFNEAQVTGLVAVGGIVGETGAYCSVMRCYNGTITDLSDWTRNQTAGKVVSTRWNKPMTGGIVGETHAGKVGYCANYAEIRNVQTGYYTAGIAGCVFASDDYPAETGEVYACFNSGGIYTVNTVEGVEYREAGICGQNEGYVHDCIVMKGTVPYHGDSAIGANDWGAYANLQVLPSDELASSQGAALLNSIAAQTGDWSCYWFVNRVGYPVLNTWAALADDARIALTAATVASAVQVAPAPWLGEGAATAPQLKVTLRDGTVLVQDADFLVVPQAGAWEMSAGGRYRAGITGIGMYRGTVDGCASYDIGACDLSLATVQVSPMKYAFGRVVFPVQVSASVGGAPISASELDFVVYGRATSVEAARSGKGAIAVFDSAGYVSYTADGALKTPVSEIAGGIGALNAEQRAWWLYDRNYELISDSAGNSYYTSSHGSSAGRVYGANTSCVGFKGGSPAGYVVKVSARQGSAAVSGDAFGHYVVEPIDLYRECSLEEVAVGGRVWHWDADKAKLYADVPESGGQGRDYDAKVTFTGASIEPVPTMRCGGYTLAEGLDYRVSYGDPDPAAGAESRSAGVPNRNVTGAEGAERAALTILPQNAANMSNYVVAFFSIEPAALEDCDVGLATREWAYTGEPVEPAVNVTLDGVALQEGVDYEVDYRDNTEKGVAGYTVRALDNLGGGEQVQVSGTFEITDGESLEGLALGRIADQQFNWGYDVHPALAFFQVDGNGEGGGSRVEVPLVEGVDYVAEYSKSTVTKWPDSDKTATPCVVTVKGMGKYTGQIAGTFDIVPYDAGENATGQLRAFVQDVAYGKWGYAPAGTRVVGGVTYATDALVNVGMAYPVMLVQARPIVDWRAYEAATAAGADLEESGCYGSPVDMTTVNDNANGGLASRFPGRYFDGAGHEVNGNGGMYFDAQGSAIAFPARAEPGTMTARVELRCGIGGARGGAVGMLDCGTFEYGSTLSLADVDWSVGGACAYDGSERRPVRGVTQSGIELAEGASGDYTIVYREGDDLVRPGVVHYTATAVEGEGKHFTGVFQGAFSIMPANLSTADGVTLEFETHCLVDDAAAGVRPEPKVKVGDVELREGVDYTLSYLNNTKAGTATVFVNGMGNYTGTAAGEFTIAERVSVSSLSVSGVSNATYTGAPVKRVPTVKDGSRTLAAGRDYTVVYLRDGKVTGDFTSAGIIVVRIAGTGGSYRGTRDVAYQVTKAANPLKVSARNPSALAYSTVKRTIGNPLSASAAQGAVTYAKTSGSKYLSVGAGGKIAVAAKTPVGTHTLTISAAAAGNSNYNAAIATESVKVKVTKAANVFGAKAVNPTQKVKAERKTTLKAAKVWKVTKNASKGKVTYKKVSGNSKISVASNGAVTVRKGLKKGAYKVKVKLVSAATKNYKAATKTLVLKVRVA